MQEHIYYTWETHEYTQKEINPDWIWALGIITIITIVLSIMYKNYLFGVLMTLGTICIVYLKLHTPKKIHITITDRSIRIGEEERYYHDIGAFWIDVTHKDSEGTRLLIAPKKSFSPLLTLSIPNTIPLKELKNVLLEHIEEKQMKESGIYEIMEKLGF